MKLDKLKVHALEFILLAILSFALFVSNMYSRIILAIVLVVCTVMTHLFLKKRNVESINSKKVTIILFILALIYLIAFYLMGLYFGYYDATVTFSMWSLINYIIPMSIIIIVSEILRNILLAQNTKSAKIVTFIIMVLIDVIIYIDIYDIMSTYDNFIETIGFTFFVSVACNLLYNYTSARYGFKGNIIYRLITVLYVYIIPIIPNVIVFFRSILRIVYPYIIYQVIEYTFTTDYKVVSLEDRRKNIIFKIILGIFIVLLAMLVSCKFKYGLLVVGSGSMTGTVNKGDAVFYQRYEKHDKVEAGDVIIFWKDDLKIVHRVVDITTVNGEVRYITKGDANSRNDEGYITNSDIIGITKFKIIYIGYPSIWMREAFSNNS